jgi:riboflavin kinase/FMN adenylyltransferase
MTAARQIDVGDATSATSVEALPCALVIGNFDGVHKGHQAVLMQAVAEARAVRGWLACALTFDPHPAEVVGSGAPPLLTSMPERVELIGLLGVDRVYVRRFDAAFAGWSPERFAEELVIGALGAKVVVVGQNFRFGAKRAGDLALLRALGQRLGFDVRVAEVASDAEGAYSSTRVRDALASGDLDAARRVLGRPHAISGVVVHGAGRGRTIGFPTANIDGIIEMLPADGVYAVGVERLGDGHAPSSVHAKGVANIGIRPTVGGSQRTVEAYLLGFNGDLYGARLRLHLLARLRSERKFSSLDELKAQIARDTVLALSVLAGELDGLGR